MKDWLTRLLDNPDMLDMGHCQRREDLNLGMGWLYYGLTRLIRPRSAVVIGSYRGFTPLVIGRGIADNVEDGIVHFIDPSLVDEFWKDGERVRRHFESYGVTNIVHHLTTTQAFVDSDEYRDLKEVGLLLVDGLHTAEQARFDYRAFAAKLTPDAATLFHDSIERKDSRIYGEDRRYTYSVVDFIEELKADPSLQVLDLPFGFGLTMVRSAGEGTR